MRFILPEFKRERNTNIETEFSTDDDRRSYPRFLRYVFWKLSHRHPVPEH